MPSPNEVPFLGNGIRWIDQDAPFQRAATGTLAAWSIEPTAVQASLEEHDTDDKEIGGAAAAADPLAARADEVKRNEAAPAGAANTAATSTQQTETPSTSDPALANLRQNSLRIRFFSLVKPPGEGKPRGPSTRRSHVNDGPANITRPNRDSQPTPGLGPHTESRRTDRRYRIHASTMIYHAIALPRERNSLRGS